MLEQVKKAAWIAACWMGMVGITPASAQYPGWQQRADYTMDVQLDTAKHGLTGHTVIAFTNNSPDELDPLHFHLFFNAFRPGSMMDVRSRNIVDPDRRVGSRIYELPEDEWGSSTVSELTVDGKAAAIEHDGTLLTAYLDAPVAPGATVELELDWEAIVPRQIRRSGWMNSEGVEYSMTQWFPKLCEYDHWGWHTDPYVGREFHGIFGNYDVTISAPAGYVIGGTGVLQDPDASDKGMWKFKAENVLDFAWAADPDFVKETVQAGRVELNCYHQSSPDLDSAWSALPEYAARAMAFFNELIGPYPYPQYSIIQGGDGGMEYPMATLITGNRSLRSLVGVTVHEMAHSWFQAVLATNESLYEFMDEGMTSYASSLCMQHLFAGPEAKDPFRYAYAGYIRQAQSGNEEPLSTHADHYSTNRGYGVAAYSKGEVLIAQLRAVIGPDAVDAGLKDYYRRFAFKHPGPIDLMRCMERASGLELDWYFQYFVYSTHQVDYAVESFVQGDGAYTINLQKIGGMPMPSTVEVRFEDGSSERFFIPLRMMRGALVPEGAKLLEDWPWVDPNYAFTQRDDRRVVGVELDPAGWVADVDGANDVFPRAVVEEDAPASKKRKRRKN